MTTFQLPAPLAIRHRSLSEDSPPAAPLPPDFLLSVVIPVYNEVKTLEAVLARVKASGVPSEIIIVDDGSTDGTRELLAKLDKRSGIRILLHEKNRGKGAALRTGFAAATGTAVIIQDADLEYDPADYRELVAPIAAGEADVVYGSRFLGGKAGTDFVHAFGNRMVTWVSNLRTGLSLTDVETCYKLIRREVLQAILPTLGEEGFAIELELTSRLARTPGLRWREVPIRYQARSWSEGKKLGLTDVLWTLWCVMRY